jgi:hypothetical protein
MAMFRYSCKYIKFLYELAVAVQATEDPSIRNFASVWLFLQIKRLNQCWGSVTF